MFESYNTYFQGGDFQLEVVNYRPATAFPILQIKAMKSGRNKSVVFLQYDGQVSRDYYCRDQKNAYVREKLSRTNCKVLYGPPCRREAFCHDK